MPNLELIDRRPVGPARATPLLFVHGSFCGAWIWDEHTLPWFAARGWRATALSLRGHGGSEGADNLAWTSLEDYVEDVVTVFDRFETPPILIGHSMGGMVVQRALLRRRAPAAVLLASAPPHGLLESALGLFWRMPGAFWQFWMMSAGGVAAADLTQLQRAMFSGTILPADAERLLPRFQDESQRVLFDMMAWNPAPQTPDPSIPILVLGAADDPVFPPEQVRAAAQALGTEAEIVPDMAHAMMLDRGWERVAERIERWLGDLPQPP